MATTFPFVALEMADLWMNPSIARLGKFFNMMSRVINKSAPLLRLMKGSPGVMQWSVSDDMRTSALLVGAHTYGWSATRFRAAQPVAFETIVDLIKAYWRRAKIDQNDAKDIVRGIASLIDELNHLDRLPQ